MNKAKLIPLGTEIGALGRVIGYGWNDGLYCALLNRAAKQITKIPAEILEPLAKHMQQKT
jgi:hypothetical protein